MTSPRVLLCARADLLRKPGGDTRTIIGLKQQLGSRAELCLDPCPSFNKVDLVQVFNITRPLEPFAQAHAARQAGLPVVLTPIYQDLQLYNRFGRQGTGKALYWLLGAQEPTFQAARLATHAARLGRLAPLQHLRLARDPMHDLQQRLLDHCDLLICNSAQELKALGQRFSWSSPAAVVPVGIDPDELQGVGSQAFCKETGLQPGFLLCAARIEDLKNQLGLLRALRHSPLPLVLAGRPNPLQPLYAARVKREAARRAAPTLLLQDLPRPLLLSAMAGAAVHVLPSWFESAGLASLEAAAAGAAVVSTSRGFASDYLGDGAFYCDPGDPASIARAVEDALERGPSSRLRSRALERFTLQRSAEQLTRHYQEALR